MATTEVLAQTLAEAPRTALRVDAETLLDATLFTALAVLFLAIAVVAAPKRRRGLTGSAVAAVLLLGALWLFARVGETIAAATLYEIVREALLALLAFAVIRTTLLFASRVLLARLALPHILTDVLLGLALIVYALYRLNVVGVNLAGIVTTSAVITGAIAFSAQEILGTLWAGLALQGERTLRQGDWIRINDKLAEVVQLRWRSTSVTTDDNDTIVIPNAALMKDRIHLVGRRGEERVAQMRRVAFSVSYDVAPAEVTRVVREALRRANVDGVEADPPPYCLCRDFEDSGIGYNAVFFIRDLRRNAAIDSAVRCLVYAVLARHGMSIPYPHRVMLSSEAREAQQVRGEQARRHAVLREVPLFASLNDEERRQLAAAMRACPFVAGDMLVRQGDPADSLYVLASGRLSILHEDGDHRVPLAELAAPAYFGERGLLLGQPRAATVVAVTDVLCYRLDKEGFDAILRARPEIVDDLSAVLVQRQSENDARLQELDAESRARHSSGHTADFVRRIRAFFHLRGSAR